MFKITATETFEPSLCVNEWKHRAREFDFVLFITKNLTPEVIGMFTDPTSEWSFDNIPSVIHVTCTGWGGSPLEPNVPDITKTSRSISDLISAGYPVERIVLRADPLIPVKEGPDRFIKVCNVASKHNIRRVRCSVMQMYKHVLERLNPEDELTKELLGVYNGRFFPDPERSEWFYDEIRSIVDYNRDEMNFESCASGILEECGFENIGCMSEKDLRLNNINPSRVSVPYGNQRKNCLCLLKEQLIPGGFKRGRCPNNCVYCYLKDKKKESEEIKSEPLF